MTVSGSIPLATGHGEANRGGCAGAAKRVEVRHGVFLVDSKSMSGVLETESMSGVISPLIWVISIVTLLLKLLITTP